MSSELNESLTDEIEQLQLQLNSLRSQIQNKGKKNSKRITFDESFGEQDENSINSNQMRHELDAIKT
jgi:hypothetical protein